MGKLADVRTSDLRSALEEAETSKAAKRLMVALAYKYGTSVDELAEWYAIPRSTLYYWLDRFEEKPIREAVADEKRPGRPPKLSKGQRETLEFHLNDPPTEFGHNTEEWTPKVVAHHIEQKFEVTYSIGHSSRLLEELSA